MTMTERRVNGSYLDIDMPGGAAMSCYIVEADGARPRAALVILQEIFGVNADMRQTADAFAALGYDVAVPDLFWRQEPRVELDPSSAADRERASTLMKGLDQNLALDDAAAALGRLGRSKRASGQLGAVGYCLGGKLAFLLATRAGIGAAVSYYGVGIHAALDRADGLQAPLLLHIAEKDELCPPPARAAIHAALGARPGVEIIDHPGVGHAFARRGGVGFDGHAADQADAATAAFLSRHLRGEG